MNSSANELNQKNDLFLDIHIIWCIKYIVFKVLIKIIVDKDVYFNKTVHPRHSNVYKTALSHKEKNFLTQMPDEFS